MAASAGATPSHSLAQGIATPGTKRPGGEPPDGALVRALSLTRSHGNGGPGTPARII
jgi:hypothetical protein